MKKLIPTVCLALMGAAAVTGSTYAWFSMNKSVEATGMKVKATTPSALVIGTSLATENAKSVNFNDASATELTHSTHDAAMENTGLKTVDPDDDINASTGVVTDPHYVEAVNPEEGTIFYYVDYEVYIASAGAELEGKDLVMSMTDDMKAEVSRNWGYNMSERTLGMADTLFGFTVDVYSYGVVTTEDAGTLGFVGTYHLDDKDATIKVHDSSIPSSINEDGEDPIAQGIHLLLRVYLDGEYGKKDAAMTLATGTADGKTVYFEKSGNNYVEKTVTQGADVSSYYVVGALSAGTGKYVHTEKANTNDLNLGFHFDAVDHVE